MTFQIVHSIKLPVHCVHPSAQTRCSDIVVVAVVVGDVVDIVEGCVVVQAFSILH